MPEFETIGKYEVLDVIGEGGFGVVYKARDPLMERFVAIKVCSTEDEQIRKRFLREAKIAGGLDHPNIVTAFEFGTEKDVPYLVQELLTGEDLRSRIDRQDPIEVNVKVDYLAQVAKGLKHAHAQGVLHRDIKPANVRILDDNRVKLMDFGMAKITTESGTKLTQDGSVMGTAGYFAPEQLKALELDQRVDIFSYGVLSYELLTYHKAFPGDTFMIVFRQVLQNEPERILSVWPDCPEELAGLVEKCLCKEREDRFNSFDEILPILYSVLSSSGFDRRAQVRGAEEPPEPPATVLKPISAISTPAAADSKPSIPEQEETQPAPSPAKTEPPDTKSPRAAETTPPRPAKAKTPSAARTSGSTVLTEALIGKKAWIIGGSAILLLAAFGLWLGSRTPEEAAQPTTAVGPVTNAGTEAPTSPPSVPTFAVLLEANPWGEVSQIIDASGSEIALPESLFTPVALRLPEGSYTITVTDFGSGGSESCQVSIAAGSKEACKFEFPPLDAIDYFKDAGWWE